MNEEDDFDSANDSDYEPVEEGHENDQNDEKSEKSLTNLSSKRKRKATELWNKMVEEDQNELKMKMNKIISPTNNENMKKKQKKINHKQQQKLKNMLQQIFGKSQSTNFIQTNEKLHDSTPQEPSHDPSSELHQRALESVKLIQRDRKIKEIRKFAGQSIEIERNIKAGESGNEIEQKQQQQQQQSKEVISSLDKVLTEIKGPQTISTVTKSSFDWEGYKTKEGIEEEVANASKEGYLTRKEFLERCDYRQFEKERDERLAKAASRMK